MGYSKTLWVDGQEPSINAERLNKIESGISNSHGIAEGKPSYTDVDNSIAQSTISTIETVEDNISSAITNMGNTINPQLASINQDIATINSIIPNDEDIVTTVNNAITTGAYGLNSTIENTAVSAIDDDGRWALASDVTNLQATSQTESQVQATAIQEIQTAVLDGDIASTQYVQNYVSTAVTEEVLDEETITALANTAITTAINQGDLIASAQDMTDLQADVGTNTANINTLNQTLTSNNSAYTQSLSTLNSRIDGNDTSIATLTTNQQTFTTEQSALATEISTLSSTLGDNYVTSTDINATYATNAGVNAMRQVALDANGKITGWTAANGDSGSSFLIQADQFAITDQTRSTTPFAIDTTTGQAIFNGKVSFTNVTDTGDVATIADIPTDYVTTDEVSSVVNNALPSDIVTESGLSGALAQAISTLDYSTPAEISALVNSEVGTVANLLSDETSNREDAISNEATARINAINNEASTRAEEITARIVAEATLDGKITEAEQSVIDSATTLTTAYQTYTNTVKQALIDGEITAAEQNAINAANAAIIIATEDLVTTGEVSSVVNDALPGDIVTESGFQTAFNQNVTTIDGGKITTGVIYNAGGSASNYSMKIDLNAGSIHIK